LKPYYDKGGITIYCADYKDVLPVSADAVITDPPYNVAKLGTRNMVYENTQMQISNDDYIKFCLDWLQRCKEITNRIIFTSGNKNLFNYPRPDCIAIWYKPGSKNVNMMGGISDWEPILIYGKPPNRLGRDVFECQSMNLIKSVQTQHPCPKPPPLWLKLIAFATKENETILDPFLGSGTTAVCAKKLGRKCIGIEISEKYCEIAVKRLAQEVMELGV